MNRNQKIALWVGIGLFVLAGLFPPWIQRYHSSAYESYNPRGYAPIFVPPRAMWYGKVLQDALADRLGVQVDWWRLEVQWAIIIVVTAGAVVTLKSKPTDTAKPDR